MTTGDLRAIPSVERVLNSIGALRSEPLATEAVRRALANVRDELRAGRPLPTETEIAERARAELETMARPSLRRVINASGVLLQTNLGRAPLSERALAAIAEVARGYSNLEYDLEGGERGSRHEHVRDLIRRATGAEDGIVVNNNAAALFMALRVFAEGR